MEIVFRGANPVRAGDQFGLGRAEQTTQADDPWVVFEGKDGPGKGKHIVFVSGDEEYRSEELMPQLAKILAVHHGFKCTVLFAIDRKDGTINPKQLDNIPGLEAMKTADLMVIFTRFRDLPDDQMKFIVDYLNSGKPVLGLRTATHAFHFQKNKMYAKYSFNSKEWPGGFGRQVLGETWINHYGTHQKESTRGLIAKGMEGQPIVRGCEDVLGTFGRLCGHHPERGQQAGHHGTGPDGNEAGRRSQTGKQAGAGGLDQELHRVRREDCPRVHDHHGPRR